MDYRRPDGIIADQQDHATCSGSAFQRCIARVRATSQFFFMTSSKFWILKKFPRPNQALATFFYHICLRFQISLFFLQILKKYPPPKPSSCHCFYHICLRFRISLFFLRVDIFWSKFLLHFWVLLARAIKKLHGRTKSDSRKMVPPIFNGSEPPRAPIR